MCQLRNWSGQRELLIKRSVTSGGSGLPHTCTFTYIAHTEYSSWSLSSLLFCNIGFLVHLYSPISSPHQSHQSWVSGASSIFDILYMAVMPAEHTSVSSPAIKSLAPLWHLHHFMWPFETGVILNLACSGRPEENQQHFSPTYLWLCRSGLWHVWVKMAASRLYSSLVLA